MTKSIAFKKLRSIFRNEKQDVVFNSSIFANAFRSLAKMVSNRFDIKDSIDVKFVYSDPEEIAYTDNKNIVINLDNVITKKVDSLEDKYLTFLGMLGHECGHLLFTNFNIFENIRESFYKKEFYIPVPIFNSKTLTDNFEKIKKTIFSDGFNISAFIELFFQIQNILEDKYVNYQMSNLFPGAFKSGIKKIYELMFENVQNGIIKADFLSFIECVHEYLEFGTLDNAKTCFKEFSDVEFISFLDSIKDMNNHNERIKAIYVVLAYSADYFLKDLSTAKAMQQAANILEQSSETTAIGKGGGYCNQDNKETQESNSENNQKGSQGESQDNSEANQSSGLNEEKKSGENTESALSNVDSDNGDFDKSPISISEILDGCVRGVLTHEPEKAKEMLSVARTNEVSGFNDRFSVKFNTSIQSKEKYNSLLTDLKPIVKRLKRGFDEIVDDKSTGLRSRNLLSGRRVNPSASATAGGKVFMKNTLPEDLSEVAVCVLIDQSGSMMGDRIETAQKASIILAEFCLKLNIPYSILGHNFFTNFELSEYVNFEDSYNNKYSLSSMSAGGCNRDGFALRYAAKMLSERPEESKLLFLISDGWPSAYLSRREAEKDILKGISFCKKNDILLSALAIGEDKEQIQKIYGDAFVNISDLSKLPKHIINKVKRYIS